MERVFLPETRRMPIAPGAVAVESAAIVSIKLF